MVTVAITVGVVALPFLFAGVIAGRLLERIEWNRLIAEGRIPRPQKRG